MVLGPRRGGKTTLLRQQFPSYNYVTLDDFDAMAWAERDPKGFIGSLRPAAIIDEIQRLPKLMIAVKYWSDRGELEARMTGSSTLGLMEAGVETLAGRFDMEHLPTLCWGETLGRPTHSFFEDEVPYGALAEAQRELPQWMELGGFPEIVSQPTPEHARELLARYRDTYFIRDVAQLSNIENLEALHIVFRHLVRCYGLLVEVSTFAKEAGISVPTAKRYLNTLTQTELGFRVYGGQFDTTKRLTKASKMYFSDSGVATSFQKEIGIGARLEAFVLAELEKRRKLKMIEAEQMLYYRSAGGAEVDLIFEEPTCVRAIEVKASEHVQPKDTRNLRRLREIKWTKPLKLYVAYQGLDYREMDGVRILPIAALRGSGFSDPRRSESSGLRSPQ